MEIIVFLSIVIAVVAVRNSYRNSALLRHF